MSQAYFRAGNLHCRVPEARCDYSAQSMSCYIDVTLCQHHLTLQQSEKYTEYFNFRPCPIQALWHMFRAWCLVADESMVVASQTEVRIKVPAHSSSAKDTSLLDKYPHDASGTRLYNMHLVSA